ncbi:P-loop containing nucleoside triphosphate hydrolase superfamily protein [Zea mays]|nr:P-loop containing nucleoside triphosphate hydrolase superfamily protein [Zea mays]
MDSTEDNKNFVKSKKSTLEKGRTSEGLSYAQNHETKVHDSARSQEKNPKDESDGHKDLDQQKNNATKKDKPAAEPIIVPIVLRMSDFDHKALLEEWIATRAFRDNCIPQVSMEALVHIQCTNLHFFEIVVQPLYFL